MTKQKDPAGRIQLVLLSLVFFGPLILATWMYFGGTGLQPEGRSNHGQLLDPLVNVGEALPDATLHKHNEGHWLLVYSNRDDCDAGCEFGLLTLRQSRLMLGREMERLRRVFLHGDTAPDTVFLANEHAGLIVLQDESVSALLEKKSPSDVAAGGFFLIDPLGNLVMYFGPDIDPSDMVEDIEHLLKLSRIG